MGNIESLIRTAYYSDHDVHRRPNLRHLGSTRASELSERAEWTLSSAKVARRLERFRRERAKAGKSLNERARTFVLGKARFERSEDDGDWECTAILGEGSFGIVGRWSRFDRRGDVVDDVAIKQIEGERHANLTRCVDYTIPMEALCMYELRDCPTVCRLRKLKRFDAGDPSSRVWRLYQEYCSNSTILDMVNAYRRHNAAHPNDRLRIPESYIWFVWYGLALCLRDMSESGRCAQMRDQPKDRRTWILHMDIKDSNVLLGDCPSQWPFEEWPLVKVCDWGLAHVTSKYDDLNSAWIKKGGTTAWCPPEQYHCKGNFDRDWRRPIYEQNETYTSAHGCWAFAAIIFGMVQLDTNNKVLDRWLEQRRHHEEETRRLGYRLFVNDGPNSDLARQYSKPMLDLLEGCLSLRPDDRPSPSRLVEMTLEGCRGTLEALRRKGRERVPYVFYGKNGFADMMKWSRLTERAERAERKQSARH